MRSLSRKAQGGNPQSRYIIGRPILIYDCDDDEPISKMRIITSFLMATLITFVACPSALAEGAQRRIDFSKDRNSAVVRGSVSHGERITYLIGARAGQELEVRIVSIRNRAVFAIYEPLSERTIRGAEQGQGVKHWKGYLSKNGDYRVVVDATHDKATYRLAIFLK